MKLVAVVLAAGSARRFGSDKLSAEFRGEPLITHAIRAARAAPVQRVIIVATPWLEIGSWEGCPPVSVVRTANVALSASLKAGMAEAGNADGAFIFLGDMPLVPPDEAHRLAAMLGDNYAAVPRHDGLNGHPVLFAHRAFADIASLEGDEGAGRLLKERADVAFDACPNECIHLDVDRPEDISRLEVWGETGRAP